MSKANPLVIDADGHILEDSQYIIDSLPSPYGEIVTSPYNRLSLFPSLDHLHTPFRENPATRIGRGNVGPEEWDAFLSDVGIQTTVLYPSGGLSYGLIPNPDVAIALTRAYNDWLHQTYISRGARFQGMGLIPMQDPAAAALELRRIVQQLGMLGAMLPARGLKAHLGAREYWPVYEEANRLQCCLAVHGGAHGNLGMDDFELFAPVHALGHPFGLTISLAGMVFNGIFEKFPNVRIAFLEGGVAWFLMALERFNSSWSSFSQPNPRSDFLDLGPGRKVSDYLNQLIKKGRLFLGCEGDELLLSQAVKLMGNEAFMYSSDFPHEVTTETCKEEIEEILENEALSDDDKEAVLSRNAQRFYRLDGAGT